MSVLSRQHFARYAGGFYLVGNVVMTAKGFIESGMKGSRNLMDYLTADPLASLVGILFLVSASMLSRTGGNTRGLRRSQLFATSAFGVLTVNLIMRDYAVSAIIGAMFGMAGCLY